MVGGKAMNQLEFFVDLPRFDSAKCADIEDKDFFFPDNRTQEAERLHQLKAICASCIHETECLEYALEKQIPYGIWGGSTPADRDTVAIAKGKSFAFKGIALTITKLHKKGISANEIAAQLDTSPGYVRRVLRKLAATEQGAVPLHQQIKDSSEGSH
jgi:WhiB family transcriptional regulator, redox-sensing transcriptional regulator